MCILLLTTRHPDYPLILLSNRDEFFRRPTKPAHFRELASGTKILSPLDLGRPERGTWIGVTTSGRLAVLVNYREDDHSSMRGPISRGILPLAYLCSTKFDQEWDKELDSSFSATETGKLDLSRIGGFTLVHGHLKIDPVSKRIEGLNIISNRGDKGRILVPKGTSSDTSEDNKSWVHSKGEQSLNDDIEHKSTFGLSNSLFNHPWSKVTLGESLLDDLVDKALAKGMTEDDLVSGCFDLLSHDTYPKELLHEPNFEKKFNALRYSIFIPPLKTGMSPDSQDTTMGSLYGTRMQTVILLNKNGDLKYYERDLHSSDIMDQLKVSTSSFEFNIA